MGDVGLVSSALPCSTLSGPPSSSPIRQSTRAALTSTPASPTAQHTRASRVSLSASRAGVHKFGHRNLVRPLKLAPFALPRSQPVLSLPVLASGHLQGTRALTRTGTTPSWSLTDHAAPSCTAEGEGRGVEGERNAGGQGRVGKPSLPRPRSEARGDENSAGGSPDESRRERAKPLVQMTRNDSRYSRRISPNKTRERQRRAYEGDRPSLV